MRNIMPHRGLTLAVLPPARAAITYTHVVSGCGESNRGLWRRATTPIRAVRAGVIFSSTRIRTVAAVRAPKRSVVVVLLVVVSIVAG